MARRGHGEGTIRKRADGRWEAQFTLADGSGRKSLYGKTRADAARALTAALRDQEQGLPIIHDERQTLATFLPGWLASIAPTLDEETVHRHRQFVELHILPLLGRVRLAKLTPQQVQQLYANRLAAGLATTTVNHLHATLHKALESAVRLGLVARNVTDLVDPPRPRRVEMQVLSADQARRFLEANARHRLHALYVVALATGMRQGELLALRWADVDLDEGRLRVRVSLRRPRGRQADGTARWRFKEPKTKRSRRTIALAEPAITALRAHRTRQLEERLFVGAAWTDLDLVFCSEVGTPLFARNLYRAFLAAIARAGLPRIRFHDLRHTCATLLLGARVNPKVVSEMLGHASIAITLDIYAHVLPDMQQDAAEAMTAILAG